MIDKQEYKVRFYTQENGKSEIFEFLNGLNDKEQAKFLGQVVYLKENGANVPRPYADTLRDGIHELRLKL